MEILHNINIYEEFVYYEPDAEHMHWFNMQFILSFTLH